MDSSYDETQRALLRGWNTWNTRSVLSHVRLPDGLTVNLGLREYRNGHNLVEAVFGKSGALDETIVPGPHAYDGSYTELRLSWRDIEVKVETASEHNRWVALVTPMRMQKRPATVYAEGAILWDRPGVVCHKRGTLEYVTPHAGTTVVGMTGRQIVEPLVDANGPYLAATLDGPVGFFTGRRMDLEKIEGFIEERRRKHDSRKVKFGDTAELYDAMQTCLAWDTIYDPVNDRAISPVSRLWNGGHGGWVLFCWDTYFAALMASVDNKNLAYSNAIAITREHTENGFVPNYAYATGQRSRDRSQPPVGSMVVREIYRKWRESWFVREVFDDLLRWNRWWPQSRQPKEGLLAWGSNPIEPIFGNYWETEGVNCRLGAALESGLDNSPMYDDAPFDPERHTMLLADAGLMGLYAMDCECLADLAQAIGRTEETELRERAAQFRNSLGWLWDEATGIYRNRKTESGEFSSHLAPTHFYPLLSGAAKPEQASRMVREHLMNPGEFWGEYVLPSISRDDAGYKDNNYWRGRIWAPLNFLVYLGLRNYDLPEARRELARKSAGLLLKEWREKGHIHENYNAETGDGDDVASSDKLYHWGALLALIALIEDGHVEGWEKKL